MKAILPTPLGMEEIRLSVKAPTINEDTKGFGLVVALFLGHFRGRTLTRSDIGLCARCGNPRRPGVKLCLGCEIKFYARSPK